MIFYQSAAAVLTRLKGTPTAPTPPTPPPPPAALSPLSGLFSTGPVVSRI